MAGYGSGLDDLLKQFDQMRTGGAVGTLSPIESYVPAPRTQLVTTLDKPTKVDAFGAPIRDGFQNGRLSQAQLTALGNGYYLQAPAANAYAQLAAAAQAAGVNPAMSSAYRTYDQQAALYHQYLNGTGNLAAAPGSSNHGLGLSIDFSVANNPSLLSWLRENGEQYGFYNDVPSENWHYTYYGPGGYR
jgi:LAS superfamily LD-carboxypeptidase LdcB